MCPSESKKHSHFDLREKLCLKVARFLQHVWCLTFKQQLVLHQLQKQQSGDFSQIHAADHLLKTIGNNKHIIEQAG